jgi:ribonuclease HI
MAILRCTEPLLFKNVTRRIYICSDKRAAMAALAKTTTNSALVWKSMQVQEKLSGSKKDTLVWTPRQHGIPRNEEADKLAEERTNEVPNDQTVGIPFVVGKEVIRRHLRQEHL